MTKIVEKVARCAGDNFNEPGRDTSCVLEPIYTSRMLSACRIMNCCIHTELQLCLKTWTLAF